MSLFSRAASLAVVPVKSGARFAGAATISAFGGDKDAAYGKALLASAEELTAALAKARGPVMKFGQLLALFSSTLPPEQAEMLSSLTRLYEDAEPRPYKDVEENFTRLPAGTQVDEVAVAAASLGQVHTATWPDGRRVAIKVQYPDAHRIVRSDLLQLRTFIPLIHRLIPTLDVKALLQEHADRLWDELDYNNEAKWQEKFREVWDVNYPGVVTIPAVIYADSTLLVTEWLSGIPYASLPSAPVEQRDQAARNLARFTLWSPRVVGAIHADPHPGNFRLMEDGSIGVLDFGSVGHPAGEFTELFVRTFQLAAGNDLEGVRELWLAIGMIMDVTSAEELARIISLDLTPYVEPEFRFSSDWITERAGDWSDPGSSLKDAGRLSFPPNLLLEHRAVTGMLALFTSIDATVDFQKVIDQALSA